MTPILLIIAAGLSLLLASCGLRQRTEITALARAARSVKKPTTGSKEEF